MKKRLYFIALLAIACTLPMAAQKATGFSEMKLFLDPGHYGIYNQGYGGYSEAEKVLQVGLAIKDYLLTYTDMKEENIKFSRQTDADAEITMSQRGDICRTMGAHLLYSIHSDAPSVTAFSTLLLYGGRREYTGGPVIEKLPEGGKKFGDILVGDLTSVLRAIRSDGSVKPDNSRGNIADRTFYGGDNTTPYLGVHNSTVGICASLLSEGGFHTNPVQNMQFVNVEFKKMQAYAAYQSLVKYLSEKHLGGRINPVQIGIATGFVFDNETMAPINGAKITILDGETEIGTYTTDTYASLPKKYSFRADEFGNGFYWFDKNLTPGATYNIKVEATGFAPQQTTVTIPATIGATTIDGLGVKDFQLLNQMPAKVKNLATTNDLNGKVIARYPMEIVFDRKMDKPTVEAAVGFAPAASVTYSWPNDFTLRINISNLAFETAYTLTIDGSVAKNLLTEDFLDGNGTGTPGGNFVRNFTTSDSDTNPPVVVSYDPQGIQEESARPIVRIEFNEYLNTLSFGHTPITVTDEDGIIVEGSFSYHTTKNFKSVMHYVFNEDLKPQQKYTVTLVAGIEDTYGNATTDPFTFDFTARPRETTLTTVLYDFDNTLGSGWWTPDGSGSTAGIVTATTKIVADAQVRPTIESKGSARLDYQWLLSDPPPAAWRIRLHNTTTAPKFSKNNQVQFYLFGNGSKDAFAVALRNAGAGPFWTNVPIVMSWVGWKLITWDLANDPYDQWTALGTGTAAMPTGDNLNLSALRLEGAAAAERSYELTSTYFARLRVVKLGDYIPGKVGIENITVENGISVSSQPGFINISADAAISNVKVYSISGALLKSVQPQQNSWQIPTKDLIQGVYIVKVTTATSQKNVKTLVK